MAERRSWRRLVESYTVVVLQECRSVGMVRRGVLARRCGCGARWRNDVPSKVDAATKRYVMGHPGSTAKQLQPRRLVTPGIDLHRSRPFNDTAASLTRTASATAPLTTHHALRVYLLLIGRRPQPGSLIPTLARHVAESTAGWTPRRLPVRTVQARAARYAHGCSTCTWLFPFADHAQVNPPSERFAVQSRQPPYELTKIRSRRWCCVL
jgi:hypothetical protein